ncbi:dsRBD fold-containing protein [Flexivirga sp. B27]
MSETWNVTIFIEEDGRSASAHARLTGGAGPGHLVGTGSCRVTPTALQDAGQRAAVHALEDLSQQLDRFMVPQRSGV